MNKYLIAILIFTFFSVSSAEVDRILLPQRSFCSSVFKSLGDAGIAFPVEITGGMINPALVFSYRKSVEEIHGSITTGYGRDSVYDRHILPLGASYSTSEGAIGFFYRLLKTSREMTQHEAVFNLSGQLAGNSENQGAVDFGVNIRFEKFEWNKRPLGSLAMEILSEDSLGNLKIDSIISSSDGSYTGRLSENRLLFDIGFYQPNVWPNTDFGLTLRNLTGYIWAKENPVTSFADRDTVLDSAGTDSAVIRNYYYSDESRKSGSWTEGKYRTLSAGVVYHVELAGGNLKLSFPLDFEFLGLFDKKTKNRVMIHGGMQAQISKRFNLRAGYSRAPGPIKSGLKEIENINIFTGGAGISITPVTLDFYISHDSFGTTATFDY